MLVSRINSLIERLKMESILGAGACNTTSASMLFRHVKDPYFFSWSFHTLYVGLCLKNETSFFVGHIKPLNYRNQLWLFPISFITNSILYRKYIFHMKAWYNWCLHNVSHSKTRTLHIICSPNKILSTNVLSLNFYFPQIPTYIYIKSSSFYSNESIVTRKKSS